MEFLNLSPKPGGSPRAENSPRASHSRSRAKLQSLHLPFPCRKAKFIPRLQLPRAQGNESSPGICAGHSNSSPKKHRSFIYGGQDPPGPDQDPPPWFQLGCAGKSHPCHPQATTATFATRMWPKKVQDVTQGQDRTETAPESWSTPKNAGSSFSWDPEAKSLPR